MSLPLAAEAVRSFARPPSPYVGLEPYDEDAAAFFFGRSQETSIVAANLRSNRLTILYGPSGVGKSSLLMAGVAHSLHEQAGLDKSERPFAVCTFRSWRIHPVKGLREASRAALQTLTGEEPLPPPDATLAETLRTWTERAGTLLVILDQFEEYFQYHPDEGDAGGLTGLAAELARVVNDPSLAVHVLLSIREDAWAKLDRFEGHIPSLFTNYLRVDHLDLEAARETIEGPIAAWNRTLADDERLGQAVTVEPELVERVLDEVGAGRIDPALGGLGAVEGAENGARIEAPYLQLVMQRIWDEERAAGSDALGVDTLERLGGARHIVEEHLQGAMAELTPEQKDVAARLFNHLVTPSGTKIAHEVSDLADFGQVPAEVVRPVLATLAERRILRSLEESGGMRYEIFHDVLAQPVLAWRAQHRTEREIERQLVERHRRRSRFQRLLALGAAALGIVAVVTGFALVQRANANAQAREAKARSLDASAIRQLEEDPELSLLLASESARRSPAPTAEDALRRSLLTSHVRKVYKSGGPVTELGFAPDGRHVAFTSDDGQARVVEPSRGRDVTRSVGPGGGVSFAKGGGLVLLRGSSTPPQLVAPGTGDLSCELGPASAADATTAGEFAVVVRNGIGYVWRMSECTLLHTIGRVGETAVRVVASPNGGLVAFLSGREARIVDVPSGRAAYQLEHRGEITSLAFSTDGRRIITGGRDRLARIWNGFNGKLIHELEGHQGQVLDVAIGLGGTEVATASTDGTARIWDGVTGLLRAPLFGHTNFVRAVDFSPDGQSVVTASVDGTARTWALSGRRLATLAGHTGAVVDAQFSPDGFTVLTGGEDGTVRFWEAGTRPSLSRADIESPERPTQVATSPDGGLMAEVDGAVVRLERSDGTTQDLAGHRLVISSVGFSPDGKRLLTAGRDHDAILWDVDSGNPLRVLRGHFGSVSDARFSPDGRWIVTAGPRSVGLWKAADGELTRLLVGPEGPFAAAMFLTDSRTIVAVTDAGIVSRYECQICGEIPELLDLADVQLAATGRELTPEERELYFG